MVFIDQVMVDQGGDEQSAAVGDDVAALLFLQPVDFVDQVALRQYSVGPL